MDTKKVEELLEEWQNRLGLQDWIIALSYNCKPEDMELEDCCGETSWQTSIKDASIRILEEKYCKDRIEQYDFEKILIHELLHLKFALLDNENNTYESTVAYNLRHQLIDDLAKALIMAKRGKTYNHNIIVQDMNNQK